MTSLGILQNFSDQPTSSPMMERENSFFEGGDQIVRKLRLPSQRLSGRLEKLSQRHIDNFDSDSINSGRSGDRSDEFDSPDREMSPPQHVNVASLKTHLKPQDKMVNEGLYFSTGVDPNFTESKRYSGVHSRSRRPFAFPLPIMDGLRELNEYRPFKLPYNIYCPGHSVLKIPGWRPSKKNTWVDVPNPHSSSYYHQHRNDQHPTCNCTSECGEDCLNRLLQCECDAATCPLGEVDCGNRAFQILTKQLNEGRAYAKGFEIFETKNRQRGFGLKAIRSYLPGELIVEYTGDVISQSEVQRRLNEEYKNAENYYMLSLGKGLVIDSGMKGSPARFVNHSCNPNSQMQKWFVGGMPRIGLFSGPEGIPAGTEISYDYNFAWFDNAVPQKCLCGESNCRGTISKRVSPPENVTPMPKATVEEPATRRGPTKIRLKYGNNQILLPGKRPVGRPRKYPRLEVVQRTMSLKAPESTIIRKKEVRHKTQKPVYKRRGRPLKPKISEKEHSTVEEEERGGGPTESERPESEKPGEPEENISRPDITLDTPKRGRGRPRKIKKFTAVIGHPVRKLIVPLRKSDKKESKIRRAERVPNSKKISKIKEITSVEEIEGGAENEKSLETVASIAPVKRGRGRPPKIPHVEIVKRGRGRPPKFPDLRGVGRPRKRQFMVRASRISMIRESSHSSRPGISLANNDMTRAEKSQRSDSNIRNGWTRGSPVRTRSVIRSSDESTMEIADEKERKRKEEDERHQELTNEKRREKRNSKSSNKSEKKGKESEEETAERKTKEREAEEKEIEKEKEAEKKRKRNERDRERRKEKKRLEEELKQKFQKNQEGAVSFTPPYSLRSREKTIAASTSVSALSVVPISPVVQEAAISNDGAFGPGETEPQVSNKRSTTEDISNDSSSVKRRKSRLVKLSISSLDIPPFDDESDFTDQTSEFMSDPNSDNSKKRGRPRKPADELKIYRRTGKPRGRPKKVRGSNNSTGSRLSAPKMRLRSSARRSYREFVESESEIEGYSDVSDEFEEPSRAGQQIQEQSNRPSSRTNDFPPSMPGSVSSSQINGMVSSSEMASSDINGMLSSRLNGQSSVQNIFSARSNVLSAEPNGNSSSNINGLASPQVNGISVLQVNGMQSSAGDMPPSMNALFSSQLKNRHSPRVVEMSSSSKKLDNVLPSSLAALENRVDDSTPDAADLLMNLRAGRIRVETSSHSESSSVNTGFMELSPQNMSRATSNSPSIAVPTQLRAFPSQYGNMPLVYYSYVDGPRPPVMIGGSPAPMPYVQYQPVYAVSPQFPGPFPYPVQLLPAMSGAPASSFPAHSGPLNEVPSPSSPAFASQPTTHKTKEIRSWRNIVGI